MERASAAFWISKSVMDSPYQNIEILESRWEVVECKKPVEADDT